METYPKLNRTIKPAFKPILKKVIASARYFKNKKEVDMWHCVWHEGKPYDYHLCLDNYGKDGELLYEVDIYSVPIKKNGMLGGLNELVYLHTHTFPYDPKLFGTKKYKVYMSGWTKTTLEIEAESEEEAEMFASTECAFDSTDECIVTEIKEFENEQSI